MKRYITEHDYAYLKGLIGQDYLEFLYSNTFITKKEAKDWGDMAGHKKIIEVKLDLKRIIK